jgi:hypothetical protein
MPIVITSNWPPLVAMSVVTRERSVPSSRVTRLELDVREGFLELWRELLHLDHVAVVDGGDHQVGCRRRAAAKARQAIARVGLIFMGRLLSCF